MKNLEKLKLIKHSEISDFEMKKVVGGAPNPGNCCVRVYCGPILVQFINNISSADAYEISARIHNEQSPTYCGGGHVDAPPSCGPGCN